MMTHIKLSSKNGTFVKQITKENKFCLTEFDNLDLEKVRNFISEFNETANDKQELIIKFTQCLEKLKIKITARGSLDVLSKGYGFIRYIENNFQASSSDVYISVNHIRKFNFKQGKEIYCFVISPKEKSKYFVFVDNINPPTFNVFEDMIPVHPYKKFDFHLDKEVEDRYNSNVTSRLIDLISPFAKGQRALIVAPPKSGKTVLMKAIAKTIISNHPEVFLVVLLIDERPEEATDMQQFIGNRGKVVYSSFDSSPAQHVKIAETTFALCKSKIENNSKLDVVVLLDSLTKLTKAFNARAYSSGKVMPGGIEPSALRASKSLFGLGRQIKEGGSLTIIATTLIDHFSRITETIFEEFKGTGNSEIVLDRDTAEKYRIFPPIDISKSGTRREEDICKDHELKQKLRQLISKYPQQERLKMLIEKIKETKDNHAFLEQLRIADFNNNNS